jgi:hypothetical protein
MLWEFVEAPPVVHLLGNPENKQKQSSTLAIRVGKAVLSSWGTGWAVDWVTVRQWMVVV